MEWGIAINLREPVQETIEKAVLADEGGIDAVWITDYPATRISPILASVVAQKTEHCRIGIGLLSLLIFSPSQITQYLSSLINLYGDRFDLLVGPGDRTRLKEIGIEYGEISTLVERMAESITTIREGLSDYKDCKVLVGAQGEKMIKKSVVANGVLFNYSDPVMIRWASSFLRKKSKGFKMGIFPPSLVGSRKLCKEHMGIMGSAAVVALGLGPTIMKRFELSKELQSARREMKKHGMTNDVIKMIDFNTLNRFCLCGEDEQTFNRLRAYEKLGVEHIVFGPPQGTNLRGVQQLVDAKKRYYHSI